MPFDDTLLLLNRDDLGADNDGTGSGADETSAGGAVVDVPEESEIAVTQIIGRATAATIAEAAETLAQIVEVSVDGGSNWVTMFTFPTRTASDAVPSVALADGGVSSRWAAKMRLPRANAGQSGLCKVRMNTTASDNNHWDIHNAVVDPGSVRDEDLDWIST